ncbi:hypothetical protein D7V94_06690 [Parablautia intestinalis]|uniref:Glycosyl transferase n=2 Tax=Parablautia intestinalis TaxID=2320100 RepID=A0A3A9AXS2_9FIRM|nr:hypothetical protein D7V94_06690 [Parablautia intestinalis]
MGAGKERRQVVSMKVIAMYLPQFHKVKENDLWWGEGFSDWVSAQNTTACFEGHYQPHLPLNNYYYDLMQKETMQWQADMMHKYGVDGMCIYHYWFENGRRILEKPAENLLKWKDIDMPFCFCWANETWARSWGNIKEANSWTNVLEVKGDNERAILLNQDYGDVNSWKEHFDYLYPFFKDSRYIKIDGRPLFLIYKSKLLTCLKDMLDCWRKWAKEKGFPDLYIIGCNCSGNEFLYLDAELYHEPLRGSRGLVENLFDSDIKRIDYSAVWNNILSEPPKDNTYYGAFVGYDDTPRRGIEGVVVENGSPELFGDFLTKLMAKNAAQGNDITFINAWNEWGEGMHLEPDQKYGLGFLEQINISKNKYHSISLQNHTDNKKIQALQKRSDKFELYLNDLDIWMTLREQHRNLSYLLLEKNIHTIAIYGFGIMGKHLKQELEESNVNCLYIIDRQKEKIHADLPVYSPLETLPNVDSIIVSSYYFISEISLECKYPLISLGDLLHEEYSRLK